VTPVTHCRARISPRCDGQMHGTTGTLRHNGQTYWACPACLYHETHGPEAPRPQKTRLLVIREIAA
jgi:hypothetical protein